MTVKETKETKEEDEDYGRIDVRKWKIENIIMNFPDSGRCEPDKENIEKIKNSIKKMGQLHPVLCKRDKKHPGKAVLLMGFHRYLALKELKEEDPQNFKYILVRFQAASLNDAATFLIGMNENLVRANLSPLDKAFSVGRCLNVLGLSAQEVADGLDKSIAWVYQMKSILELPQDLQNLIRRKDISAGYAIELSKRDDCKEIVESILKKKKKVEEVEEVEEVEDDKAVGSDEKPPEKKTKKKTKLKVKTKKKMPVKPKKKIATITKKEVEKEDEEKGKATGSTPSMSTLKKVLKVYCRKGMLISVPKLISFLEGEITKEDFVKWFKTTVSAIDKLKAKAEKK